MKKITITVLICIIAIKTMDACTTFVIKDSTNLVYGRNYDFPIGLGFITINMRGIEKQAIVQSPYKPAKWISKYGSITFNQEGIDAPMEGINEKGLVIAQMGLLESKYPQPSPENVLNQLEWIQYQLDVSATLDDVIENNRLVSIIPVFIPVHYLICDKLGNIGVIEFFDGELKVYKGNEIKFPVCSNMFYGQSLQEIKAYKGFGGDKIIPEGHVIAIAAKKIDEYKLKNHVNPIEYSFEILNSVGSTVGSSRTQWSIVYDIKNLTINFKTLNNKEIRIIDLNIFSYSCDNQIQILDIQKSSTNIELEKQFINISYNDYFNYKKILMESCKSSFNGFPDIPDEMIKMEVDYALNRKCKQ
jgi:choloylglycine hydrolase